MPVAGLDRMVLTDQPAVRDLMALADALLLPSDDLTFACLLTSPLGGLTDDELSEIADGSDRHAVGHAARSRGRAPVMASRRRFVRQLLGASTTFLPMRCLPRRWVRSAAALGCSPAWGRKRRSQWTNCSMRR